MTDPQRPGEGDLSEPAGDEQLIEPEGEKVTQAEPRAAERRGDAPRRAARSETRAAPGRAEDELPYVDDRVSKVWVLLIVATFVAIFAYGLLFGQAGMLTPQPTPSPSPTPVVTPSPAGSPSPGTSQTPGATTTPAASPTTVPGSPTAAPPS